MKVGGLFGVGGGVLEANVGIISWSLVPAYGFNFSIFTFQHSFLDGYIGRECCFDDLEVEP